MTQHYADGLQAVEMSVQQRFASAQQRVLKTDDAEMKRYYKGQLDAFRVMLRDLDNIRFECGLELPIETSQASPPAPEPEAAAIEPLPASSPVPPTPEAPAPAKRRTRKKAVVADAPKAPPVKSPYEALASQALERGVITRNVSWFFHDFFPTPIKGFRQLHQTLEENPAFRQVVQEACAQLVPAPQESAPVNAQAEVPEPPAPAEEP